MRIVKDPDTRKQEILEGALRVFAQKGYDKTTISDIAKELGISQGLCYRYYASKEEIYDAALEAYTDFIFQANLQRFQRITKATEGKTLKDKIMSYNITDYKESEKQDVLLYDLFHHEGNRKMHDQLMLKLAERLIPLVVVEIEQACERGEIQVSNVEAVASFCVYGQVGIMMKYGKDSRCNELIRESMLRQIGIS